MPGKVRVKLLAARNLPVMDRASEACDAFGEVKLGNTCFKTEICKKSLNPQWNSDWFRFEVDDEELQDEPLQIRIMDYDTYSANDAIGKVYIDLNPLLVKEVGSTLSGWLPIYDTMHGIRGEVNLVVRIDLFSDSNRYRESSCGVRFFYSSGVPLGHYAQAILGFVEELVVNDDPEYKWIDKIRTPRASNEARQTLFSKLSGEVQRRIGHKALELGGNAVVGYQQCFDLEGESGVVVRGIGTAVTLVPTGRPPSLSPLREALRESPSEESPPPHRPAQGVVADPPLVPGVLRAAVLPALPGTIAAVPLLQRASDPDLHAGLAAATGTSSGSSAGGAARQFIIRPALARESLEMLEYPFITMKQFPHGFIRSIGGVVSARSVKLLDQINNPDEPETRDAWWTELRKEIRSHTRSLSCNVVLGYIETTNICDEVAILSASGTAVLLNPVADRELSSGARHADKRAPDPSSGKVSADSVDEPLSKQDCKLCHIPYSEVSVPFQAQLIKCAMCRRSKVPDILFMTIEPPPGMPVTGKSCLIQARVCRNKKDLKGEQNAREISDSLPFLEFELHRQILSKLKLKNMNVIFGLKVQVSVGERVIAGIATGTGACLTALPLPSSPLPKLVSGRKDQFVSEPNGKDSDTSEDERDGVDLPAKRGACIVQLDDAEDAVSLLREPHMPEGFAMCNTELMPGLDGFSCNLQLFMQTYRAKLFPGIHPSRILSQHFDHIIQSLFVKLRKLVPCCLASLSFHIELPDQDELQVAVLGTAVGLEDGVVDVRAATRTASAVDADAELIFPMDEERVADHANAQSQKQHRMHRLSNLRYQELCRERHGVDLTSLDHVPGGKTEKYLGNLDFFFIRESTGIREEGGLNGFVQGFMTEILAIVRAHVSSLGGNAVVAFRMTQCVLLHNPHKNQGQCLINVAGDAVLIHYQSQPPDSEHLETSSSSC
uniref:Putative ca2+-dependent phospholipid-binding protein n=2 Tax=Ixodes ricinus TaxID=34613 RepID=A0A131XVV3_IXORI